MQISRLQDLSTSLWGISLPATYSEKKNRPEKNCFIATNNRIVFTVRWSVKYFFAPDSQTFRKNRSEEEKDGEN